MIEVANLTKVYGSNTAVDNISFQVKEGEVLGFLGANGAGKSTTMNIITGYLSATEGVVSVNGHNLLEEPMKAKGCIGYLPEHPPLYPGMTVESYLNFVFDLKKISLPRKKHLAEVCEWVRIADIYKRVIGNLSKGYRQRLGIAQALLGYPPVLILDEPTVGIDPMQMVDIRNLVKNFGSKHTVVFSSHILSEVQTVCDKVLIIHRGKILADDTPEALAMMFSAGSGQVARIDGPPGRVCEVLRGISGMKRVVELGSKEEGSHDYLLEASGGIDLRREIFYKLAENNWPLMLPPIEASLEDIFFKLVESSSDNAGEIKTQEPETKENPGDMAERGGL